MRGGVREQNKLIQLIRKKQRKDMGMSNGTGVGRLAVSPPKTGVKRTRTMMGDDTLSADFALYPKRKKFA